MSQLMSDAEESPAQVRRRLSTFHRAKIAFLLASFASLVLSVALWVAGERTEAIFVGLWVPSIHSLGSLVLAGERDRDE